MLPTVQVGFLICGNLTRVCIPRGMCQYGSTLAYTKHSPPSIQFSQKHQTTAFELRIPTEGSPGHLREALQATLEMVKPIRTAEPAALLQKLFT